MPLFALRLQRWVMSVQFPQKSASQSLLVLYQETIGRSMFNESGNKKRTMRSLEAMKVCDRQTRMDSSGYDTTIGFCAVSAGCVILQCLLAVFLGRIIIIIFI